MCRTSRLQGHRDATGGTWTMQLGDSAETVEVVDGFETPGVKQDTTCEHFQIPYACEPIQERQVRETVTTTTSTAAPLHFGLALTGSGQCPDGLGVSPVPLSRCQEAAAKAILPPGAKRGRTALQAGYNVGSKDPAQPWQLG
ncbi:hypothetical protein AK812_SmicGene45262, partial [Symbiodinium microadriaticum]